MPGGGEPVEEVYYDGPFPGAARKGLSWGIHPNHFTPLPPPIPSSFGVRAARTGPRSRIRCGETSRSTTRSPSVRFRHSPSKPGLSSLSFSITRFTCSAAGSRETVVMNAGSIVVDSEVDIAVRLF